jgi:hypothetical protein
VRRVGARNGRRDDKVEIIGVRRGPLRPVVGTLESDRAVYDHCFRVGDRRSIIYTDRHARRFQRLDPARASARRFPIREQPDINAPLLRADQRPYIASQSSSGAKQTSTAALVAMEAAVSTVQTTPNASGNAIKNTHNGMHDYVVGVNLWRNPSYFPAQKQPA